jgi:hypothetical protein
VREETHEELERGRAGGCRGAVGTGHRRSRHAGAPVKTSPATGVDLYDFRTTRTGWATVALQGNAGDTVTIQ